MPRQVSFGGFTYTFPSNATDEEIQRALKSSKGKDPRKISFQESEYTLPGGMPDQQISQTLSRLAQERQESQTKTEQAILDMPLRNRPGWSGIAATVPGAGTIMDIFSGMGKAADAMAPLGNTPLFKDYIAPVVAGAKTDEEINKASSLPAAQEASEYNKLQAALRKVEQEKMVKSGGTYIPDVYRRDDFGMPIPQATQTVQPGQAIPPAVAAPADLERARQIMAEEDAKKKAEAEKGRIQIGKIVTAIEARTDLTPEQKAATVEHEMYKQQRIQSGSKEIADALAAGRRVTRETYRQLSKSADPREDAKAQAAAIEAGRKATEAHITNVMQSARARGLTAEAAQAEQQYLGFMKTLKDPKDFSRMMISTGVPMALAYASGAAGLPTLWRIGLQIYGTALTDAVVQKLYDGEVNWESAGAEGLWGTVELPAADAIRNAAAVRRAAQQGAKQTAKLAAGGIDDAVGALTREAVEQTPNAGNLLRGMIGSPSQIIPLAEQHALNAVLEGGEEVFQNTMSTLTVEHRLPTRGENLVEGTFGAMMGPAFGAVAGGHAQAFRAARGEANFNQLMKTANDLARSYIENPTGPVLSGDIENAIHTEALAQVMLDSTKKENAGKKYTQADVAAVAGELRKQVIAAQLEAKNRQENKSVLEQMREQAALRLAASTAVEENKPAATQGKDAVETPPKVKKPLITARKKGGVNIGKFELPSIAKLLGMMGRIGGLAAGSAVGHPIAVGAPIGEVLSRLARQQGAKVDTAIGSRLPRAEDPTKPKAAQGTPDPALEEEARQRESARIQSQIPMSSTLQAPVREVAPIVAQAGTMPQAPVTGMSTSMPAFSIPMPQNVAPEPAVPTQQAEGPRVMEAPQEDPEIAAIRTAVQKQFAGAAPEVVERMVQLAVEETRKKKAATAAAPTAPVSTGPTSVSTAPPPTTTTTTSTALPPPGSPVASTPVAPKRVVVNSGKYKGQTGTVISKREGTQSERDKNVKTAPTYTVRMDDGNEIIVDARGIRNAPAESAPTAPTETTPTTETAPTTPAAPAAAAPTATTTTPIKSKREQQDEKDGITTKEKTEHPEFVRTMQEYEAGTLTTRRKNDKGVVVEQAVPATEEGAAQARAIAYARASTAIRKDREAKKADEAKNAREAMGKLPVDEQVAKLADLADALVEKYKGNAGAASAVLITTGASPEAIKRAVANAVEKRKGKPQEEPAKAEEAPASPIEAAQENVPAEEPMKEREKAPEGSEATQYVVEKDPDGGYRALALDAEGRVVKQQLFKSKADAIKAKKAWGKVVGDPAKAAAGMKEVETELSDATRVDGATREDIEAYFEQNGWKKNGKYWEKGDRKAFISDGNQVQWMVYDKDGKVLEREYPDETATEAKQEAPGATQEEDKAPATKEEPAKAPEAKEEPERKPGRTPEVIAELKSLINDGNYKAAAELARKHAEATPDRLDDQGRAVGFVGTDGSMVVDIRPDGIGVVYRPTRQVRRSEGKQFSATDPTTEEVMTEYDTGGSEAFARNLIRTIYGGANPGETWAKEVLQNILDALDMKRTDLDDESWLGTAKMTFDTKENKLTVSDNGIGMSPEFVEFAFLKPGMSGKREGEYRGNFGIAKFAIMGIGAPFRAVTVYKRPPVDVVEKRLERARKRLEEATNPDDKLESQNAVKVLEAELEATKAAPPGQVVRTTVEGTGERWVSESKALIGRRSSGEAGVPVSDDTETGTKIEVDVDKRLGNVIDPKQVEDYVKRTLASPMLQDKVTVEIDGKEMDIEKGKRWNGSSWGTDFSTINKKVIETPFATFEIYFGKPGSDTVETTYAELYNRGLLQNPSIGFGQLGGLTGVPTWIKVNVKAKVKGTNPQYPWEFDRRKMRDHANAVVTQFLKDMDREANADTRNKYLEQEKSAPKVGKDKASGEDVKLLTPENNLEPAKALAKSVSHKPYVKKIATAFAKVARVYLEFMYPGENPKFHLAWLGDTYFGVNAPKAWYGDGRNRIMVNPWAALYKARTSVMFQKLMEKLPTDWNYEEGLSKLLTYPASMLENEVYEALNLARFGYRDNGQALDKVLLDSAKVLASEYQEASVTDLIKAAQKSLEKVVESMDKGASGYEYYMVDSRIMSDLEEQFGPVPMKSVKTFVQAIVARELYRLHMMKNLTEEDHRAARVIADNAKVLATHVAATTMHEIVHEEHRKHNQGFAGALTQGMAVGMALGPAAWKPIADLLSDINIVRELIADEKRFQDLPKDYDSQDAVSAVLGGSEDRAKEDGGKRGDARQGRQGDTEGLQRPVYSVTDQSGTHRVKRGTEITAADLKANLPPNIAATLEQDGETGDYIVTTPNGAKVVIKLRDHIEIDMEALEAERPRLAKAIREGRVNPRDVVHGAKYTMDGDAVIELVFAGALAHEFDGHVFFDHFATDNQRKLLVKKFEAKAKEKGVGVQEVIADAMKELRERLRTNPGWQPKGAVGKFLKKVYDFFHGLYRTMVPTADSIMKDVVSGKAYNQELRKDSKGLTLPPQYAKARVNEDTRAFKSNVSEQLLVSGGSAYKGQIPNAKASDPSFPIKATPKEGLPRVLFPDGTVKYLPMRGLARIMGIPDSYPLPSNNALAKTILGNGVPPQLMRDIVVPLLDGISNPEGITTFSGGEIGFQLLGDKLKILTGVEYDPAIAAHSRKANDHPIANVDIRQFKFDQYKGIDYFHASPVCKNFSDAKAQRGEVQLDIETATAVANGLRTMKPKVFTLENVPKYANSEAMGIIEKALRDLGYTFDKNVYDSADYGVPQHRNRLILRAKLNGQLPPLPAKKAKVGWWNAVKDLDMGATTRLAAWQKDRLHANGLITLEGEPTSGQGMLFSIPETDTQMMQPSQPKKGGGTLWDAVVARGARDGIEVKRVSGRAAGKGVAGYIVTVTDTQTGNSYTKNESNNGRATGVAGMMIKQLLDERAAINKKTDTTPRVGAKKTFTFSSAQNAAGIDANVQDYQGDGMKEKERRAEATQRETAPLPKYSTTTYEEGRDAYEAQARAAGLSEQEIKDGIDAANRAYNILIAKPNLLPIDTADSPIRGNLDFGLSLDFDTNCPRAEMHNAVINAVQLKMNKMLGRKDHIALSLVMRDYGWTPQCTYCYTGSGRANRGQQGMVATEGPFTLRKGKPDEKTYPPIDPRIILDEEYRAAAIAADPFVKEHYDAARSFMGGAGANVIKPFAPWRAGALLKAIEKAANKAKVDPEVIMSKMRRTWGLRIDSNTDFKAWKVLDFMQAVVELASMNMPAHAYTKEEDFVVSFLHSGIKFNISLKGDADATYTIDFDAREGADPEFVRWAAKNSDHAGGMMLGVSERAIIAGMRPEYDDVVHQIIPYHLSGATNEEAEAQGHTNFDSKTQAHETPLKPHELKEGQESGHAKILRDEHKDDLETYLDLCEQRGVRPRFRGFIYELSEYEYQESEVGKRGKPLKKKPIAEHTVKGDIQRYPDGTIKRRWTGVSGMQNTAKLMKDAGIKGWDDPKAVQAYGKKLERGYMKLVRDFGRVDTPFKAPKPVFDIDHIERMLSDWQSMDTKAGEVTPDEALVDLYIKLMEEGKLPTLRKRSGAENTPLARPERLKQAMAKTSQPEASLLPSEIRQLRQKAGVRIAKEELAKFKQRMLTKYGAGGDTAYLRWTPTERQDFLDLGGKVDQGEKSLLPSDIRKLRQEAAKRIRKELEDKGYMDKNGELTEAGKKASKEGTLFDKLLARLQGLPPLGTVDVPVGWGNEMTDTRTVKAYDSGVENVIITEDPHKKGVLVVTHKPTGFAMGVDGRRTQKTVDAMREFAAKVLGILGPELLNSPKLADRGSITPEQGAAMRAAADEARAKIKAKDPNAPPKPKRPYKPRAGSFARFMLEEMERMKAEEKDLEPKTREDLDKLRADDPVGFALYSVTNYLFDNMNRTAHGTDIGRQFSERSDLAEMYKGGLIMTPQRPDNWLGARKPIWKNGNYLGQVYLSRSTSLLAAAIDTVEKLGRGVYGSTSNKFQMARQLVQDIANGDERAINMVLEQYKANLQNTIAHELLHGFRDTRDTGVPDEDVMQKRMNKSADEMLDEVTKEGTTLRDEISQYFDAKSMEKHWRDELVARAKDNLQMNTRKPMRERKALKQKLEKSMLPSEVRTKRQEAAKRIREQMVKDGDMTPEGELTEQGKKKAYERGKSLATTMKYMTPGPKLPLTNGMELPTMQTGTPNLHVTIDINDMSKIGLIHAPSGFMLIGGIRRSKEAEVELKRLAKKLGVILKHNGLNSPHLTLLMQMNPRLMQDMDDALDEFTNRFSAAIKNQPAPVQSKMAGPTPDATLGALTLDQPDKGLAAPQDLAELAKKDPVGFILYNATNFLLDNYHRVSMQTQVGQDYGTITDTPRALGPVDPLSLDARMLVQAQGKPGAGGILESYEGSYINAPRSSDWYGLRAPAWLNQMRGDGYGGTGAVYVSRGQIMGRVVRDYITALGFPDINTKEGASKALEVLDKLAWGDEETVSEIRDLYKMSLMKTLAHEILHGFRGTIDTLPGGAPIEHMQKKMNESAIQLLTLPTKEGTTLYREMAQYLDIPTMSALWDQDMSRAAQDFLWFQEMGKKLPHGSFGILSTMNPVKMMPLPKYKDSIKSLRGKSLPDAVYVHKSSPNLDGPLAEMVARIKKAYNISDSYNVIKFNKEERKITFLEYPDFDTDPHPALSRSVIVNLETGEMRPTDFSDRANPPILHRKETFIHPSHRLYEKFKALSDAEAKAGLLGGKPFIGFRDQWEVLLKSRGYKIVDGELVKQDDVSDTVAKLESDPRSHMGSRTAMDRKGKPSAPFNAIKAYLGSSIKNYSVLEWGGGLGADADAFRRAGAKSVQIWDPVYAPGSPTSADVVTTSYVVNVLEPEIRHESLRAAYNLANNFMIVSARTDKIVSKLGLRPYKDGVMMGKEGSKQETFQKQYTQKGLEEELAGLFGAANVKPFPGQRPSGAAMVIVYKPKSEAPLAHLVVEGAAGGLGTARNLAKKVASVLTPDLLSPQWRQLSDKDDDPTAGHCYAAAEALWYLTGKKLKPKVANLGNDDKGRPMTHWWLEDDAGNKVDPTAAQFSPSELADAYAKGKAGNFGMSKRNGVDIPSKRAKTIIDRVNS